MHYTKAAYLMVLTVLGWSTTSTSATCVTITETTAASCPQIQNCIRPQCIILQTVTLECSCASIFSTVACATTCGGGCATAYETANLPCPASSSSPSPLTTSVTSTTSVPSSSVQNPPSTSPSTSTHFPGGPQTSSGAVVTTTTPATTSLTSTTSVAGSPSPVQTNEGSKYGFGIVEGWVTLGLLAAVWGMV